LEPQSNFLPTLMVGKQKSLSAARLASEDCGY
jgi:hypothetical protein